MSIISIFPMKTFRLIFETAKGEYRLLDMKTFLEEIKVDAKIKALFQDENFFMSVKLHEGNIIWGGAVRFDNKDLYKLSVSQNDFQPLPKRMPSPKRVITTVPQFESTKKLHEANDRILKLLRDR